MRSETEHVSAAMTDSAHYNKLRHSVHPSLRSVGCMWPIGGDPDHYCNKPPDWTFAGGEGNWRPRVYCDKHAAALSRYLEGRKSQERLRHARRHALETHYGPPTQDQREHVIKMLIAYGQRPRLWHISATVKVNVRDIWEIALGAGLRTSCVTKAERIRADIMSGRYSVKEIMERNKSCRETIRYHSRLLGFGPETFWIPPKSVDKQPDAPTIMPDVPSDRSA